MRAVILVLILLVVVAIGAVATGFIDLRQTQPAQAPNVAVTREGVAAQGGQTPKFEVQTGELAVGSGEATVKVPRLEVRPADAANQAATAPVPATNTTQN